MLVELSVMEQRYHAVMEVVSGAPVTEVARRYGVSRQAVHGWLGRYEREGLAGLADHSHRPAHQPRQLDAGVEALICRMRGSHPRWGPRRLVRAGQGQGDAAAVPATIYRVLVRMAWCPPAGASAAARTISAGSGRSRCSCGSSMSPHRCSWPMAASASWSPGSMITPGSA